MASTQTHNTATAREIRLIVGLGNPGPEYASTRHNAGFWFVEKLCEPTHASLSPEQKFKGLAGNLSLGIHGTKSCRLLLPATYMNRSGESILAMTKFYDIRPEQVLVVHDELDLPVGSIRIKFDGGHGGHNGLRDIIAKLNTKQFYRLRIGIGHPGNKDDVLNYVLHKPSVSDKNVIFTAIDHAIAVIPTLIEGNIEKATHQLHTETK